MPLTWQRKRNICVTVILYCFFVSLYIHLSHTFSKRDLRRHLLLKRRQLAFVNLTNGLWRRRQWLLEAWHNISSIFYNIQLLNLCFGSPTVLHWYSFQTWLEWLWADQMECCAWHFESKAARGSEQISDCQTPHRQPARQSWSILYLKACVLHMYWDRYYLPLSDLGIPDQLVIISNMLRIPVWLPVKSKLPSYKSTG